MDYSDIIDQYLEKPYWVVDILPKQVPKGSRGQYFRVEEYFRTESRMAELSEKFANVLLKLNCYDDIEMGFTEGEWTLNPAPSMLHEWVCHRRPVYVLLKSADAMIVADRDDTYMTIYNPDDDTLSILRQIASSEGLFLWKP